MTGIENFAQAAMPGPAERRHRRANAPNPVDEFLQIFLGAPETRREAALQVLRGEAIAVDPTVELRPFEALLTRREAARRLGVSAQTLRRWKVPGIYLQGVFRFRLSEIEAYLQTGEFQRRRAALRAERRLSAKGAHPTPDTTNPTRKEINGINQRLNHHRQPSSLTSRL